MPSPPAAPANVSLRLPGWAWALAAYAALWLALSPHHRHPTVSVETDFPRYAAVAAEAPQWDPFVPVGYPRLLAWTDLLVEDAFRSALLLSFVGGAWLVVVSHALARRALGPRSALLATLLLVVNWQFLQNTLLAGTDALWAAAVLTSFHVLLAARDRDSRDLHGVAGVLLGASVCLRYAGFAVAPLFVGSTLLSPAAVPLRRRLACAGILAVGFAIGSLPQTLVAARDTGNPFASGQARNVWFGLHGNEDWPGRWDEAPEDVTLASVVAEDPAAFAAHVTRNVGEAVLHTATAPFGLAPSGVPRKPEVLALGVLLVAAAFAAAGAAEARSRLAAFALGAWASSEARVAVVSAAGYVVAVSTAFWMTRFLLPVVVLAGIGGAACVRRAAWPSLRARRPGAAAAIALAFVLLLASHTVDAWRSFLAASEQPIDEVGTALVAAGARPGDVVAATAVQHYADALPFEVAEVPLGVKDLEDLQLALALRGAAFFLHEEKFGPDGSYRPELDRLFDAPGDCPFLEPLWMRRAFPRAALFRAK